MNNGICDATIQFNFDCLYDHPDCETENLELNMCKIALSYSLDSCESAKHFLRQYPQCTDIQLCTETEETTKIIIQISTETSTTITTTSIMSTTTQQETTEFTTIKYGELISTTMSTTTIRPAEYIYCPDDLVTKINNDICEDEVNIWTCGYDGLDCCNNISIETGQNQHRCIDCICYNQPEDDWIECPVQFHNLTNDGTCHDVTNIELCNYDGGDCCNETAIKSSPGCADCNCLPTTNNTIDNYDIDVNANVTVTDWNYLKTTKGAIFPETLKDGFCDDELNVLEYDFDGGDCCFPTALGYYHNMYCHHCGCL
jgi:hypothetical protein